MEESYYSTKHQLQQVHCPNCAYAQISLVGNHHLAFIGRWLFIQMGHSRAAIYEVC